MASPGLRVLIVTQYYPPDLGGSATRAYNVAKGLVLNDCDVTIVAAFPHYPSGKIPRQYRWMPFRVERLEGMKIIRTLMPPLESKGILNRLLLLGWFSISSLFASPLIGKVDAIWAASWVPGMVYGRVKRRPVALNVDDLTIEDLYDLKMLEKGSFVSRMAELVYRFFYRKGDAVTPISPGYVGTIARKYGVERKRIHVVRGGVDLELFRMNGSKLGNPGVFTIVYSGAFSVAYDFDQVLEAAKILESKDDSGFEFVLQGKGETSGSVRTGIKALDLKSVKIVDSLFSRREVGEFLNKADALILPLRDFGKPYHGISSKLYEYQAVGKPIICCADGQPADYVMRTDSGLVVPPGDWHKLADAVIYLKENPEKAEEMGRQGRSFVETHLTIKAIGLQFKNILEECRHKDTP